MYSILNILDTVKSTYIEDYEDGGGYEALIVYFSVIDMALKAALPRIGAVEGFEAVTHGYTQLSMENMDYFEPGLCDEAAIRHFRTVIEKATPEEKDGMFSWFIRNSDASLIPEYLIEAAGIVLYLCFTEDRYLTVLAERNEKRMRETQMEDIRDHSAGVLYDLYERLGDNKERMDFLKKNYGEETGFMIALSDLYRRRGDGRAVPLLEYMAGRKDFAPNFRKARKEEIEEFHKLWG